MSIKDLEYRIDAVDIMDHECIIKGWVAYENDLTIKVFEDEKEELISRVVFTIRRDVLKMFPNENINPKCGFIIYVKQKSASYLQLMFLEKDKKAVEKINLIAARQGQKYAGSNYLQKGIRYLRKNGPIELIKKINYKLFSPSGRVVNYEKWMRKVVPSRDELERQKKEKFAYQPKFSFVIPLYKTPMHFLNALIKSIQEQTYTNWEICFSDGSGPDSPLTGFLEEKRKQDPRIRYIKNEKSLKISENTNEAMKLVTGDFIAFADHDDLLAPDALYECVKALNIDKNIELLYSDEDKVTMDGKHYFQPHFKSDFNIDLLRSMNYICHLFVAKKSIVEQAGLLNPKFDGAQDYDFVLRCVECSQNICHIPKILYHWRSHADSTAENPESKMYAFEAGKNAVQAHFDRLGIKAKVEMGQYLGLYRTKYILEEKPLISILIPNKDHIDDLEKCIRSIEEKSTYTNLEYIIVENNSEHEKTFVYYEELKKTNPKVKIVTYDGDFNYSKINNFGVTFASGEYLLFLNNDTQIINADCLEEMLGFAMRKDVGVVGSRLYYEDDTIQHAGVVIGFGGIAGHTFIGFDRESNGYFSRIICSQNYSAVTAACMMTKKSVFQEVGGFTEGLAVAFNDVDFCLKVRSAGKLVVYNPFAELYHFESKSRGQEDSEEKIARFQSEIELFEERWPDILKNGDPYYNPNLALHKSDFSLRPV